MMNRRKSILALCAAAALYGPAHSQQPGGAAPLDVKAHALMLFPLFIHWPESVLPTPESTLVIGVVGEDRTATAVKTAVRKQKDKPRPIAVRSFSPDEPPDREALIQCHVVYVCDSARSRLPEVVKSVRDKPVLVVSDVGRALELGVMIGLAIEDGRLSFDVGLKTLQAAGLKAEAKLLALARSVDK